MPWKLANLQQLTLLIMTVIYLIVDLLLLLNCITTSLPHLSRKWYIQSVSKRNLQLENIPKLTSVLSINPRSLTPSGTFSTKNI